MPTTRTLSNANCAPLSRNACEFPYEKKNLQAVKYQHP